MTAVEEIRRAAALMRERAQAATSGRWQQEYALVRAGEDDPRRVGDGRNHQTPPLIVQPSGHRGPGHLTVAERQANAEHIASWHPAVALAVADWLDDAARCWFTSRSPDEQPQIVELGLAVARAYLGDQP